MLLPTLLLIPVDEKQLFFLLLPPVHQLQCTQNNPPNWTPLRSNSQQRVYLEVQTVTPSVSFIASWYHSVSALSSTHTGFTQHNLLSCESDRIPGGKRDLSTPSLRKWAKPPEAHCHMFNSLPGCGCWGSVPITFSNTSVIEHGNANCC